MASKGNETSFRTVLTPVKAGPKGSNFLLAYEGEREERIFGGKGDTWVPVRLVEEATEALGHVPSEAVVTITFK
jgi:hypothetical protein